MPLAFHLGRSSDLARQEVRAAATTLPFLWTSLSVSGEWEVLKPNDPSFDSPLEQRGALGDLQKKIEPLQARLGGSIRVAWLHREVPREKLLAELGRVAFDAREFWFQEARKVGLSIWGKGEPKRMGIALKRHLIEEYDWRSRIVLPREQQALSTVQVSGERLAVVPGGKAQQGIELVAVQGQRGWWVGVTLTVANSDWYAERDFGIPAPDPVSGMLPPKLAQMLINVAVEGRSLHVHDPFCGNGRVVLEASLMGLSASGSDLVPEKVAAAQQNAAWLSERSACHLSVENFWVADATGTTLPTQLSDRGAYVLVGEPYLGRPLRQPLASGEVAAWRGELLALYQGYLAAWARAPRLPEAHVLVVPRAKRSDGGEEALVEQLVDSFTRFGYTAKTVACYDRPDSLVRRDIVHLTQSPVK
jgi:tRNA G10  N-methylase Trm11